MFIPENYIPSTPILSPENVNEILEQNPDDDKLLGAAIANEGEMAEKEVDEVLRDHYGSKGDAVLIINNLKLSELDGKNNEKNEQEADFLITNYATQTLINIEVKKFLGKYGDKPKEEWPTTKVEKQLKNVKRILGDSFQADSKGPWKIISMVYCLKMDDEIRNCVKCKKFIAEGKADLKQMLEDIDEMRKNEIVNVKKDTEGFLTFCKFQLFCCPVVPLPIGGNLNKAIQEAITSSGDIHASKERILIWCYPTSQQRSILQNPRKLFASPFGSGKTLFMTVEAIELAEKGEKVLYLIFVDGRYVPSGAKPLLFYDLEQKFENHPNVTLETVYFKDGQKDNFSNVQFEGIKHVMIDECFDDFGELSSESQEEFKSMISGMESVSIALSNSYYGYRILEDEDIEIILKRWFPGFEVVKMDKPIRLPSSIAGHLKENALKRQEVAKPDLNDHFMAHCNILSNIAEGSIKIFGDSKFELLPKVVEEAFKTIGDEFALIIVQDRPTYANDRFKARLGCNCKSPIVLCTLAALQSIGRNRAKVLTLHL